MGPAITRKQALDYELSASWWADLIGFGWAQSLAATYFAWKVNRKFARYERCRGLVARSMPGRGSGGTRPIETR